MTTTVLSTWQKIKTFIWLGLGVSCLLITFILWIVQSQKSDVTEVPVEVEAQQAARPVQSAAVAFDDELGSFKDEVPPINMMKRSVAVGEHEAEFRGSKFIAEHPKAWTLQLMKVTEEDIIRSYLSKREDRNKFQYFRLQDSSHPTQFVLTYGVYKDVKQTIDQTQNIDFALPDSVKQIPEKFSTYTALVNDLGSDELAMGTQLRAIVLTKAALPKAADLIPKEVSNTNTWAGTTTTVQRKDASGEVKSTQTDRSHIGPKTDSTSSVEQSVPQPSNRQSGQEAQIVDPF